ncbi:MULTISPECIES: DUF2490 domain-containing protein [Erythrobacter]|jgi:hypothetical protein|uniref:DUF2490 domain-containing protein n=1 Tax=Erythrobacter TaxID=1041 RepID=UPI0009BCFA52|nr:MULTISPECIES: DUF2490 domain-containing protein [Erythrobacter]
MRKAFSASGQRGHLRPVLAASLLGLVPGPLAAQDHDLQQWTLLVAQGPISDNLLVQAEIQPRMTNDASRLGQFQISPAIGYRVSKKATVFVGYMFVHTDPVDRPAFDENRFYQHIVFPLGKVGDVTVTARTRMEARTVVGAEDLAWRFRQQVRAQMPLKEDKGPLLVAWSEVFVNLNDADWGPREGMDRWRNFVGVSVPVAKGVVLEPGYLNQAVFRRGEDRFDHIASVTMFYRF